MTLNKAFIIAATRVRIDRFGRQWQVNHYDPDMRAWWQGHPMEYSRAVAGRREELIQEALELMGADHAGIEAHLLAKESGGWREVVRAFMRKGGTP